jgi:hypothetical protein
MPSSSPGITRDDRDRGNRIFSASINHTLDDIDCGGEDSDNANFSSDNNFSNNSYNNFSNKDNFSNNNNSTNVPAHNRHLLVALAHRDDGFFPVCGPFGDAFESKPGEIKSKKVLQEEREARRRRRLNLGGFGNSTSTCSNDPEILRSNDPEILQNFSGSFVAIPDPITKWLHSDFQNSAVSEIPLSETHQPGTHRPAEIWMKTETALQGSQKSDSQRDAEKIAREEIFSELVALGLDPSVSVGQSVPEDQPCASDFLLADPGNSSTSFFLADGGRAFEMITMERLADQAGEFGGDSDFLGSEFLFKKWLIRQHVNNQLIRQHANNHQQKQQQQQHQIHQQHSHHHASSPRFGVLREHSYVVDDPRKSEKSRGSLFGKKGGSEPDVALRVMRDPLVRRNKFADFFFKKTNDPYMVPYCINDQYNFEHKIKFNHKIKFLIPHLIPHF